MYVRKGGGWANFVEAPPAGAPTATPEAMRISGGRWEGPNAIVVEGFSSSQCVFGGDRARVAVSVSV